jgi:hypothetical protein
MAKIRQSNLDITAVTGFIEETDSAGDDFIVIYDDGSGELRKIKRSNFVFGAPNVTGVTPTNVLTGDGTGNHTFVITGTKFEVGTTASLLKQDNSTEIAFDTVTRNSSTQITAVIAKSSLSNPSADEPYGIKVTNGGLTSQINQQITVDQSPTFIQASGSIGTVARDAESTTTLIIQATDPESGGYPTFFDFGSGPGIRSGSIGTATVTDIGNGRLQFSNFPIVGSDTTYNFTVQADDTNSNISTRAYSFTVQGPVFEIFTSSGTFAVPTGVTSVDALVVAGGGMCETSPGGGGAGGLIYRPAWPVTPGGTITVTVGQGGLGEIQCGAPAPVRVDAQPSVLGSPGDPGLSGSVLTAIGGGTGRSTHGQPGGSGAGGGHQNGPFTCTSGQGGQGTQPSQGGDSGTYGFGSNGGSGYFAANNYIVGGGGGGAGGAGGNNSGASGGAGGVGRSYTIADGSTPVYYAGGGGGGGGAQNDTGSAGGASPCGTGGSGGRWARTQSQAGTDARGGGGGGGGYAYPYSPGQNVLFAGKPGGKGVVILRWA